MYWVTATAWIPQLVILGFWRFIIKKIPFNYTPMDWGMVFPLGMYTVSTYQLAIATKIPQLQLIPDYFVYIVIIAWLATMFNFLKTQFNLNQS